MSTLEKPPRLKILLVEDSQADADLILRQLRELPGTFEHTRVANESSLRTALTDFVPDLILSDFSMPGFSGREALKIVLAMAPEVPFLFVSGTIGEELAIDTLQSGAIDYVLKDNLRRLPTAIARAMGIAESRRDRERMERALRESEERFRTIVESSNDWIWECDASARITYSNSAVFSILGYTPEEILASAPLEFMLPADRAEAHSRISHLVDQRQGWQNWRQQWHHRDESIRVLESTATPRLNEQGTLVGFRGVDHDITDRLNQEAQIRHLARIHALLGALGHTALRTSTRDQLLQSMCQVAVEKGAFHAACIYQLTSDGESLRLTHSFGCSDLLEYIATLGEMSLAEPPSTSQRPALQAFKENQKVIIRSYSHDRNISAERRDKMVRLGVISQITLPIGNSPWGAMSLFADEPQNFDEEELVLLRRLTDEIDYAADFIGKSEQLEYLAYCNPVSGLRNRAAFLAQLQKLMLAQSVSVALIDIVHFSAVNESRGRAFGDKLLKDVGTRLRNLAEKGTLVAHPESDTFALARKARGTPESESKALGEIILALCAHIFVIDGEEIRVNFRGGLAIAPDHGDNAEIVEHNAMAALLEGAQRGLHVFVFNEELRGRAARRMAIENDLRQALENQEFELLYQPKFDTASHRLAGAEALLRWNHPKRGSVLPGEFISLLEESELIVPVGQWIMREAIRTAQRWREVLPGFRIAVNVSSRELRHANFIEECSKLLAPYSDNPILDIEVTESLLMDDIGHSMTLLQSLRDLGCRIAIDDFGTGYSSLNYLARLPVDTIKIDQSFVALMTQSPETMGLVTNIINLARSLSLKTVAEGVEDEEQVKLLRLLRCDQLQGYMLGRPVSAEAFAEQFLPAPC